MSSSKGDTCRAKDHRHVVVVRNGNYSAFNGYRRTYSDYSEIRCVQTLKVWRAKGKYVGSLPDATTEDEKATGGRARAGL